MELKLITPLSPSQQPQAGDELIAGKHWRVIGPLNAEEAKTFNFHCVSYVWGPGTSPKGSLFDCQIQISDQTRPALEAAIRAAGSEAVRGKVGKEEDEALWMDAICIPQAECAARYKTLESMGYIYSIAKSVIIVLKNPAWRIIAHASAPGSPEALSYADMRVLEEDKWVGRVWTYQELVNGQRTFFTTSSSSSSADRVSDPNSTATTGGNVVHAESFLNCVGFSIEKWRKDTETPTSVALSSFPNLNTLVSALLDWRLSGYLERSALSVLSSISSRAFDPQFPQNRILACLGTLTQEASWGPPSTTIDDLAEKFMGICEGKNDFSFTYCKDERSELAGQRWRPDKMQRGKQNLAPIISWDVFGTSVGETQRGRRDEKGFWLERMIRLSTSNNIDVDAEARLFLRNILYGYPDPKDLGKVTLGVYSSKEEHSRTLVAALVDFLELVGFEGCKEPMICRSGYFFSQEKLDGKEEAEVFLAESLRWTFGGPGLVRWRNGEAGGGDWRYCAGVYAGNVPEGIGEPLLMV